MDKRNRYLVRNFLGVEDDFFRSEESGDGRVSSNPDAPDNFLGWSYFNDFWEVRHANVRTWGMFLLFQNVAWQIYDLSQPYSETN